jgi:hypothetical protein
MVPIFMWGFVREYLTLAASAYPRTGAVRIVGWGTNDHEIARTNRKPGSRRQEERMRRGKDLARKGECA